MRVILFRQVGYEKLTSGDFPSWFWISQAASPLTAYRGVLVLCRRGFMDYIERAALGNATLPFWMTPATFCALLLFVWIAIPISLGLTAWRWRTRSGPGAGVAPAARRA